MGWKLPQGYIIRPFSSIELACAARQPGPCVRALCEAVAVLLSKNMTCERPRCNATPSEDFLHTSHCTLHTPHFTLHTCTSHSTLHLISNHVSSSHLISALLISSHLFSHVIQVSSSLSTHLSCSAHQKSLAVREKSFAQKIDWAQKLLRTEA